MQGREPLDIISGVVDHPVCRDGVGQNVYSWGSGTNYQLGTGTVSRQEAPARVESLVAARIISVTAAKFHSAALSADGKLFTWGHGRGGRLGAISGWPHQGPITSGMQGPL
jgi:alpha-tubulin suppressor-like RCC1 family protein